MVLTCSIPEEITNNVLLDKSMVADASAVR